MIDTKARVVIGILYTSPTGRDDDFNEDLSPVLAADGSVEAVAGSTRDITERKNSDEHARTILESITDAFFALGPDWRFIYVNAQAHRLQQYPIAGRVLWVVYPGLNGSEFEPVYRRAMDERVSGSLTSYYPDHQRWYEKGVLPSVDISDYFRDVSEPHQ